MTAAERVGESVALELALPRGLALTVPLTPALRVRPALRVALPLAGGLALARALGVGVSLTRWLPLARGEGLSVRLEVLLREVEVEAVMDFVEVKELEVVGVPAPAPLVALVRGLALWLEEAEGVLLAAGVALLEPVEVWEKLMELQPEGERLTTALPVAPALPEGGKEKL